MENNTDSLSVSSIQGKQHFISFAIKFIDPSLESVKLSAEVQYLIEDLIDLENMERTKFNLISEIRKNSKVEIGVKFQAREDRLGLILRRLSDRLYYNPIETLFVIQDLNLEIQIQTHDYEDLSGLIAGVQSRILTYPERNYWIEAKAYSRTQNELSHSEADNLDLLRQRLSLSVERVNSLSEKVLGPYTNRTKKRHHFEGTVSKEFDLLCQRQGGKPFAPKDVWPILQELAENLGLPTAEAEAIYQEYWQRYESDLKFKAEQEATQTAEKARLAAEAKAESDRQKQAQQAENRRDQFKALCREAMANCLYPSEYDQGRIDQARRLREIPRDEAVQIEAAVRAELYGGIETAARVHPPVDYSRLRELLHQQEWQAADLETEAAMLKVLNRDMQPFTAETVSLLPSVDLATIDALWSRYSGGRFGFKVQQQVYRHQEQIQRGEDRRWRDFQIELGWRDPPTWWYRGFKPYGALDFSLAAPQGHLPTWRWGCPSLGHRYRLSPELVEAVIAHLNQCLPLETASLAAFNPSSPSTPL